MVKVFKRKIQRKKVPPKVAKVTPADQPFGSEWTYIGEKKGGVHGSGPLGGRYLHSNGKTALFKQERHKKKVRIAKIISEAMVSSMLASIFKNNTAAPEASSIAKASLVRVPDEGYYIRSDFIENSEDLWRYAYRKDFEKKYATAINAFSDASKRNKLAKEYLETILNYYLKESRGKTPEENAKATEEYNKNYLLIMSMVKGNEVSNQDKHALSLYLAKASAEMMPNRPPGVFHKKPREVVNAVLREEPHLLKAFVRVSVSRMLLGDLATHPGNSGVLKNPDGSSKELISFDYGAGCLNLIKDFDPYHRLKTGLPLHKLYKAHILEIGKDILFSEEMIQALLDPTNRKANPSLDPNKTNIESMVEKAFSENKLREISFEELKKLCQRMGIKSRDLKEFVDEKDKTKLLDKMQQFMVERLTAREQSLKNRAYSLLLEKCLVKQKGQWKVDKKQLAAALEKYEGLADYVQHNLRKMDFVIHPEIDHPYVKWRLKQEIKHKADKIEQLGQGISSFRAMGEEDFAHSLQYNNSTAKLRRVLVDPNAPVASQKREEKIVQPEEKKAVENKPQPAPSAPKAEADKEENKRPSGPSSRRK